MNKTIIAAVAAGLAFAGAARAGDSSVAAVIGTTGLGAQLSLPLNEHINARFGVNGLTRDHEASTDTVRYDLDLKLQTADLLIDYYPSGKSMRLSAGAVYNGNKFSGVARPVSANYVFNGRSYPTASIGQVDAEVNFRKIAPYLGIGWGGAARQDKGWGFTSDFGVMFTGKPRTDVTSRNCTGPLCPQLATDLPIEEDKLRDDLNEFKYFPVIRVGVSYTF